MFIFLLRHGDAEAHRIDRERSLSEFGQQQIWQTATKVREKNCQIEQVFHSGLKRARESAEIMTRELSLNCTFSEVTGLTPNDDIHHWAQQINRLEKSTLFVGHNPYMGALLGHLTQQRLSFALGQIVCLDIIANKANLLWTLKP